jgi:ABC-type transporter Mla MlaB component
VRRTTDLVVRGHVGRAAGAALCERTRLLLRDGRKAVVVCDVAALTNADLETVEVLARLQLTARRLGGQVLLRHASVELRDLLHLAGLDAVVPCPGAPTARAAGAGRTSGRTSPCRGRR